MMTGHEHQCGDYQSGNREDRSALGNGGSAGGHVVEDERANVGGITQLYYWLEPRRSERSAMSIFAEFPATGAR